MVAQPIMQYKDMSMYVGTEVGTESIAKSLKQNFKNGGNQWAVDC